LQRLSGLVRGMLELGVRSTHSQTLTTLTLLKTTPLVSVRVRAGA
jgi:hypothetical protein